MVRHPRVVERVPDSRIDNWAADFPVGRAATRQALTKRATAAPRRYPATGARLKPHAEIHFRPALHDPSPTPTPLPSSLTSV